MKTNEKHRIGLFVLAQLFTILSFAQSKSTITGTINDSTSNKALQYVTVELQLQNANTPLKSVYSNDKGKFQFSGIDTGKYTVIISHTGFAEKRVDIVVDGKDLHLDPISLSPEAKAMDGIVIKARKPLVEQSDDKIIFNVENDPVAKTESAIDILKKTPFVSVDAENNITVNGQSNFKVLLNGRETAMFAQNVKEALKSFPGAIITKIEVMTSPSAKYDAEGVGGVINIITKKKVAGYNGSLNTYYTTTGWQNINANLSGKFGKFGITGYYGAGGSLGVKGVSRMETIPFVTAPFEKRTLVGKRNMKNFWNFGNIEMNYELDSLNTVSMYGNISGGNNKNRLQQIITTEYASAPDSISTYDLQSRNEYPTKSVGTDYIRKFKNNKEREFSMRLNGEFGISNTYLNSLMDNPVAADRYVINNSQADNKQFTFQSDYVHPLLNNRKLEAGVKAIIRRANSDFLSMIRTTNTEDYKLNTDNTDKFNYNQDVYSAYGMYGFKVKKFSFRLGGRVEHTQVNGDFTSSKTLVKQSYTNLLPNLMVTNKINNSFTMVLSYSDRLQRPYIYNLNPFKNNNDPLFISYGNPGLDPQIIHNLSLQTRMTKGATFAGITFSGSYSNNMIVQYSTFEQTTGVTSTTSGNLGKEFAVSANGNFNTKVNDKWNMFVNGSIRYNTVANKMLSSQKNSGFSGNANLNSTYTFNKRFNSSAYAGFYRNPVSIQTSYPLNLWYGISAGYKFFKEKLTLSLGVSNFFQKDRVYEMRTQDPNFQYISQTTFPNRSLTFSINWNFGKMTENVSKKKGVNNDDLLSGGNSN